MLRRGWRSLRELLSLAGDLSRLLRSLRRGRLDIHVEVAHLQGAARLLDRAATWSGGRDRDP